MYSFKEEGFVKLGAKIIIVFVSILMLCSCVPQNQEDKGGNDGEFYARSPYVSGGSGWVSHYVLETTSEQREANILDDPNIQFSVGIGRASFKVDAADDYCVWMVITAEDCVINGEEGVFRKDYEDFFQNDIYKYREGRPTVFGLGSATLYPRYFEVINISFPKQDSSGAISIELFSTHEMEFMENEKAAATIIFQYDIKNGVLTLTEK